MCARCTCGAGVLGSSFMILPSVVSNASACCGVGSFDTRNEVDVSPVAGRVGAISLLLGLVDALEEGVAALGASAW
ncbi:hypothetical protein GCM10023075_83220 [Streptosporangium album]